MSNNSTAVLRRSAAVAGAGLLLMTLAAPFAEYVHTHQIARLVPFAVAAYAFVMLLDILVAGALYVFFRPVSRSVSALATILRLIYAFIFGIAIFYFATGSPSTFSTVWNFALLFFGLHLAVLGYLAWKSKYVPAWLGALLVIAGLGYFIDSIGKMVIPNYNISIAMVTFVGEVFFMLWLLIKGTKVKL